MLSSNGYIFVGKQASRGTATIPTLCIPFLDEGFSTDHKVNILNEGQDNDYKKENIKTMHTEKFSYSCYPRPNQLTYLFGWILGKDSVAGGGDPYTHIITRDERPYLTFERKLDTSVVQKLYDAKIESLTLSSETGQPLKLSIEGQACNVSIIATQRTESYENRNPFMFFNGKGRFKFATTPDENIKSFNIKFNINTKELIDDIFHVVDLTDHDFNVEMNADFITENTTRWKNINYYGSTIPDENVYTAGFEIDCQYIQTSTRQIKITIPLLKFAPLKLNLGSGAETMSESIAGIAEKQATTELVTVICKNNIATTII